MSKLPQISAKELIKLLEKIGFKSVRQRGSHVSLRHEDGRSTTIPNHPGENLDRGLLNKILKKMFKFLEKNLKNYYNLLRYNYFIYQNRKNIYN